MSARVLQLLVVAVVAGVLAGSGLAALADAPPNDSCSDFGTLPEGSSSSGSLELWPPGRRCEYQVGTRVERTAVFGPTTGELYAWILAAALVAAAALRRRESAPLRGVAAAATLLAAAGMSWTYAGITFAFGAILLLGVEIALAVDHLLRPPGARSLSESLIVAIAVAAVAFCAILLTVFEPWLGIAIGVLGGALASQIVARARSA